MGCDYIWVSASLYTRPPSSRMPQMNRRVQQATRATVIGAVINLGLAAIKGAVGILGNSYALVADSIESLGDVVISGCTLIGIRISATPPDDSHPYGHGKAEPIAAILGGMVLMGSAVLTVWLSWGQLHTAASLPAKFTLPVLAGIVIIKEVLFRFVHRVGKEIDSTALTVDAWHHRSDALTSMAALFGIALALYGGPRFIFADKWAAIITGGTVALNSIRLVWPAILELMDTAPIIDWTQIVRETAVGFPDISQIQQVKARKMGLGYYIDIHMHVDPWMTVRDSHALAHALKDRLMKDDGRIHDALIHVEPNG